MIEIARQTTVTFRFYGFFRKLQENKKSAIKISNNESPLHREKSGAITSNPILLKQRTIKTMKKETTEVQIYNTPYWANIPKIMVNRIESEYPNKKVMVSFKPKFNLKKLKDNQMCARGDGKRFVFILEMKN